MDCNVHTFYFYPLLHYHMKVHIKKCLYSGIKLASSWVMHASPGGEPQQL